MIETGWISILPSIIAIALALITKEVYSSLLAGIITALVLYMDDEEIALIKRDAYEQVQALIERI